MNSFLPRLLFYFIIIERKILYNELVLLLILPTILIFQTFLSIVLIVPLDFLNLLYNILFIIYILFILMIFLFIILIYTLMSTSLMVFGISSVVVLLTITFLYPFIYYKFSLSLRPFNIQTLEHLKWDEQSLSYFNFQRDNYSAV